MSALSVAMIEAGRVSENLAEDFRCIPMKALPERV